MLTCVLVPNKMSNKRAGQHDAVAAQWRQQEISAWLCFGSVTMLSHPQQHVAVVAEDLGIGVVLLEGLCCRGLILHSPSSVSHASLQAQGTQ